ncbi:hypothetical protein ACQPZF_15905 [Actinosynnema sp. CS-041913]|uniref:hypothetical protein n=1 Tax=Actinosynnema sp. CS-041913 TaxID=3239917 RepID=UPI003D923949
MDWRKRREYEEMVDRFRHLVATLPTWSVVEHEGRPSLMDLEGGRLLLVLNSQWGPNLQRFFKTVDNYRLLRLIALLEVIPGEGPAHRAAVDFLTALRLEDTTPPQQQQQAP